jgi:hypothetical protein
LKNNDRCILTDIEQQLNKNNNNNNNNNDLEMKSDTRYPFIGRMMSNINIYISDKQYDFMFDVVIVILVFYSACKYKKYLVVTKQNLIK